MYSMSPPSCSSSQEEEEDRRRGGDENAMAMNELKTVSDLKGENGGDVHGDKREIWSVFITPQSQGEERIPKFEKQEGPFPLTFDFCLESRLVWLGRETAKRI